jgi:hypothetical protein
MTKETLDFIREDIEKKCVLDCCSMFGTREGVNPNFQRAFRTLSYIEKVKFYGEFVKKLQMILEGRYQHQDLTPT